MKRVHDYLFIHWWRFHDLKQQPEIGMRKYSPVLVWRKHLEISHAPSFGPLSEQLVLHIEPSPDAAPDCHVMRTGHGENKAECISQRGASFGPVCQSYPNHQHIF